ncbi:MAG: SpaA isopeptide-forming pilin-related protein [Coriobacteriia bacterium]|nr:SpaA isopeptide-forming pilin-related protein [Coriobacteriia bacterium]
MMDKFKNRLQSLSKKKLFAIALALVLAVAVGSIGFLLLQDDSSSYQVAAEPAIVEVVDSTEMDLATLIAELEQIEAAELVHVNPDGATWDDLQEQLELARQALSEYRDARILLDMPATILDDEEPSVDIEYRETWLYVWVEVLSEAHENLSTVHESAVIGATIPAMAAVADVESESAAEVVAGTADVTAESEPVARTSNLELVNPAAAGIAPVASLVTPGPNPVANNTQLNNAITAAPTDGTLTIITVTQDISVPLTLPLIVSQGRNIVLVGAEGVMPSIFRQSGNQRMFTVNGGASLTLQDIIFDGQIATAQTQGHGVHVTGAHATTGEPSRLILQGDTVFRNIIRPFSTPGAIHVANGAELIMYSGSLYNNSTGVTASGGAVVVDGGSRFTMYDGEIHNNEAGAGGGVHVQGDDSVFTMYDGVIRNNNVTGASNNTTQGGAAVRVHSGLFEMHHGIIATNTATAGAGGVQMGSGLVANPTGQGNFIMHDGEIRGNTTGTSGAGIHAVYGSFEMYSGLIATNTADSAGGGIRISRGELTIHEAEITGNRATHAGGAINAGASSTFGGVVTPQPDRLQVTLHDGVHIHDNHAQTGGGLLLAGIHSDDAAQIDGVTIEFNSSTGAGSAGPGVVISRAAVDFRDVEIRENWQGVFGVGHGGGLNIGFDSQVTLNDVIIENNRSSTGAGIAVSGSSLEATNTVITLNRASASTGGLHSSGSNITMADSEITHNEAGGSQGGAIFFAGAATGGGSVVTSEVSLDNVEVSHNEAYTTAAGIHINGQTSLSGETATRSYTVLTVRDSEIKYNDGIGDGAINVAGGLSISGLGIAHVYDTTVRNNSAGSVEGNGLGGGVRVDSGELHFHDGFIYDNYSNNQAGGLRVGPSATANIHNTVIRDNEAGNDGGGIMFWGHDPQLHLFNTLVHDNEAGRDGGGIAAMNNNAGIIAMSRNMGTLLFADDNVKIFDNEAGRNGGGAYLFTPNHNAGRPTFNFAGIEVSTNEAGNTGGGFYFANVALYLNSVDVLENEADVVGGGIAGTSSLPTEFVMANSLVEDNESVRGGGLALWSLPRTNWLEVNTSSILDNHASLNGGGIWISDVYLPVHNSIFEDNTADNHGGGIYVVDSAELAVNEGSFTGNIAALDGGGIFTEDYDYTDMMSVGSYGNLSIVDAYFNDNVSRQTFVPPGNLHLVDIAATNTSVHAHPLNNDDINHRSGETFQFTKVEDDGVTPLAGAVFRLYEQNAAGTGWEPTPLATATSRSADGMVVFGGLSLGGQYRLVEVSAPSGWITPPAGGYWIIDVALVTGDITITTVGAEQPDFGYNNGHYVENERGPEETPEGALGKILEMPAGTEVPAATFAFEFIPTQVQLSFAPNPVVHSVPVAQVPAISPNPTITLNPANASTSGGITTVTGHLDLLTVLQALSFPDAGMYIWNVREVTGSSGTTSPSYMTYDDTRFQVRALVDNSGVIRTLDILELEYVSGQWVAGNKIDVIEFVNVYHKNTDLEISKTIPLNASNELANLNTLFDFTLTLTPHALAALDLPITATVVDTAGNPVVPARTVDITGNTTTFQLMHGETLRIPNLPIGTTFAVIETAHPEFTPNVTVVLGGSSLPVINGTLNTNLSTGNHVLADGGRNAADFENNHQNTILAGLGIDGVPLALIVLAILALVAWLALRARKRIESLPIA